MWYHAGHPSMCESGHGFTLTYMSFDRLSHTEGFQYAGLCHISKLKELHQLGLAMSFEQCTHHGLNAALATLTGIVTNILRSGNNCWAWCG